jgi:hypothetical protein
MVTASASLVTRSPPTRTPVRPQQSFARAGRVPSLRYQQLTLDTISPPRVSMLLRRSTLRMNRATSDPFACEPMASIGHAGGEA